MMMPKPKDYPNKFWFKRYLHYNPITGEFVRIQRGDNGRGAGRIRSKQGKIKLNGEQYSLSKIAWVYMTGEQPSNPIFHKDGDSNNFKFDNLVTSPISAHARKNGGRWVGYFYLPNQTTQYYAGSHATEEEAITAAQAGVVIERLKQGGHANE